MVLNIRRSCDQDPGKPLGSLDDYGWCVCAYVDVGLQFENQMRSYGSSEQTEASVVQKAAKGVSEPFQSMIKALSQFFTTALGLWFLAKIPSILRELSIAVAQNPAESGPVTSGIPEELILGLILFNVFISDLDGGAECTFCKLANDMKLGGVADTADRCAAIHRDLDRLEKWMDKALTTCPGFSWNRLPMLCRMQKKLEGGTARTADPNWPKGYSIPYGLMVSIETGGSWPGSSDCCSGMGWALVSEW
ncbi:hypothetical protein QYF61_017195 [Mycteria americana]|uniref:Uncharacterized protein n=1 Tax=Mycteria americana TaxID=33587 RepID=A0AAN7RTH5_MYCAM|nr:hypothetical protein QYF61_017195 [Mycteria americana]